LNEVVRNLLKYKQQAVHSNPETVAVDAAHGVAFHRVGVDGLLLVLEEISDNLVQFVV
jgi:hypothetical protein